ncbi:hypothetical protein CISIN_1g035013mg [Citrus sinensis]|uniref:Uncharacterized protein n=1 Tax=Citrus sinensis TaxID=2711 RepID=A0A067GM82_CITSI|nr:hypothetical protein CISIN_1g035013mg [Citrus sinensis]
MLLCLSGFNIGPLTQKCSPLLVFNANKKKGQATKHHHKSPNPKKKMIFFLKFYLRGIEKGQTEGVLDRFHDIKYRQ